VTRLTEQDVRELAAELPIFEAALRDVTSLDLCQVALRACGVDDDASPLPAARMAAVPVSSGLGAIPCFSECVQVILQHIGCDAFVTERNDVEGLQEAVSRGAEVIFVADDHRFVAINVRRSVCADDDPCTANGYVAALEAAAGGLAGRDVLVLGLGPVGRAASRRLVQRGARVLAAEPDAERASYAVEAYGVTVVSLVEGLDKAELVFDAAPAPGLIASEWVRAGCIAAVPAVPSGFTPAAQAALGSRHIHEALALGVAVMAVEALRGTVTPRA